MSRSFHEEVSRQEARKSSGSCMAIWEWVSIVLQLKDCIAERRRLEDERRRQALSTQQSPARKSWGNVRRMSVTAVATLGAFQGSGS